MQKIIPHLWFDTQAKEAAQFYTSTFRNARITAETVLRNTPSGDADMLTFEIEGFSLMAISAGPYFKPNPSISFMLNFDPSKDEKAKEYLDELWTKLSDGGRVLMPLAEYPFSPWYGWVEDTYGVSWQLILSNAEGEERPFIIPALLFTEGVAGKTKEATDFYISVFKNAKRGMLAPYPAGMEPDVEGTVMFTDFTLENEWFVAMDSAREHGYTFTEGISLLVECETQEEIDYYWNKLSAVPEAEQCGWLKDAYGVSWQISPRRLRTMMTEGTQEQIDRVTQAFLPMKKLDIQVIEDAYRG